MSASGAHSEVGTDANFNISVFGDGISSHVSHSESWTGGALACSSSQTVCVTKKWERLQKDCGGKVSTL